jgi:hypothetical protein
MSSDRMSLCQRRANALWNQIIEKSVIYFYARGAPGEACRAPGKICRAFTSG